MRILLANLTKMVNDTGGLAKVTAAFANEMNRRGHVVSLVYSDVQAGNFYYPLSKEVASYDLCHYEGRTVTYPLRYKVRREILRPFSKSLSRSVNNDFTRQYLLDNLRSVLERTMPECIVAFQPAASKALLCDLHVTTPVITMSHGDPKDYFHIYPKEEIPALAKSAACQVLLPSFSEHIKEHLPGARTVVIGNSISQFEEQADLSAEKERYIIVFVGRLTKNHKRPHLLIHAFSRLASKYPKWHIEFWGSEEHKVYMKEMELFLAKHHLQERVHFMGTTTEIPSVLQHSDIFAFPSAYEGFGLALGEAMSMGLPVIGYKSCSAVNELIVDDHNGILCDDGVGPLTQALDSLMGNVARRVKLGRQARISMKKYAPQKIWDAWERLLEQCAEAAGDK